MRDLAAPDAYGMAAYSCASDHTMLRGVDGSPGTAQCPTCGHRTDSIGNGTLADGFDVIHRQWGLRGDPHAWHAMRELVAETPTPRDRDAIRAAYVAALVQVADLDVDQTDESIVHRPHLDHGGMSGGSLDVRWWRTKGLPLLVDRAADRRPPVAVAEPPLAGTAADQPSARTAGKHDLLVTVVVWAVIVAIPAATLGGGVYLLYQRAVGVRVEATVIGCDPSGGMIAGVSTAREDCVAEWTIDGVTVVGSLSAGEGGWEPGDVVDATVRGDTAYGRSLGLPILLILLGAPFLLLIGANLRHRRRRAGVASGSDR